MKRLTLIATSVLLGIGSPAFAEIENLTIDSGTISRSTGIASLSGTVTCTADHTVIINNAAAAQIRDGKLATASGSSSSGMRCTGSSQPWTVVLNGSTSGPPLEPGAAICNAFAVDMPGADSEGVVAEVVLQAVD